MYHEPPLCRVDDTLASGNDRELHGSLPRVNFPQFDSDNPQLWKTLTENYFDMYDVHPAMWLRVATMHFKGRAAGWLQSVGHRVRHLSWAEFCAQVHDIFGREQHESLIRQLFCIRQVGSVADYVEQFSVLVDHLSAYKANADPLYYTMRFVDGLRAEIKSVITIQRPTNLDTLCSLAMVQEEAVAAGRGTYEESRTKPFIKVSITTPKWDKGPEASKDTSHPEKWASADKLDSLRRYRRARGLCDRCAEKWSYGHKCSATAQLHAMEGVWDLLSETNEDIQEDESSEPRTEQVFMSLTQSAWGGSESYQTVKLQGAIQGHPLIINLVDSGSSHTFLSEKLCPVLQGVTVVQSPLKVQVANDDIVSCCYTMLQTQWQIQNCSFTSDCGLWGLIGCKLVVP